MATNQTARVLKLIKMFNEGQKVCIDSLQSDLLWEGKCEKTVRRDLDVIKEYFPDSFELIRGTKGEKGCYKAITKDTFENFMDKDTLAYLVQTFNIAQRSNILESLNISSDDKRILASKIDKSQSCYEFITKPFENSANQQELMKKLEKSIQWKRYISLQYNENDKVSTHEVKPYKIVFLNENFYLACENTNESYLFSMFRLSKIKSFKQSNKEFHINQDIAEFIKQIQTPFSRYAPSFRNHLIEVVVEIDKTKAKFFKAKKFFRSQKHIKTLDNGNAHYSFEVTQEIELESFIKSWIPYMRVLSPTSLQQKIQKDLQDYLN